MFEFLPVRVLENDLFGYWRTSQSLVRNERRDWVCLQVDVSRARSISLSLIHFSGRLVRQCSTSQERQAGPKACLCCALEMNITTTSATSLIHSPLATIPGVPGSLWCPRIEILVQTWMYTITKWNLTGAILICQKAREVVENFHPTRELRN